MYSKNLERTEEKMQRRRGGVLKLQRAEKKKNLSGLSSTTHHIVHCKADQDHSAETVVLDMWRHDVSLFTRHRIFPNRRLRPGPCWVNNTMCTGCTAARSVQSRRENTPKISICHWKMESWLMYRWAAVFSCCCLLWLFTSRREQQQQLQGDQQ